ncbi:MAG: ABC transporter permease [Desulfobacterales bacterium]
MVNLFKTISYLKISTVSLRANRLRSFLSIIGVVFGVMAVIVIIAVGEGAKAEALRQIELGTKNIYVKSVLLSEEKKQQSTGTHDWRLSVEDRDRIAAEIALCCGHSHIKGNPGIRGGRLYRNDPRSYPAPRPILIF